MWNKLLFLLLSGLLLFMPSSVQGKRAYVRTIEELINAGRIKNTTLVVKNDISLNGRTVKLSEGSVLSFKGGSFMNGTLVGNKTKVKKTRVNVFHNCEIKGEWDVSCSYSTMFDSNLEALILLKNMSCLSHVLRLTGNRSYDILACGETIYAEVIEGDGSEKPTLAFHTTDPNEAGVIIRGSRVTLRNLIVTDDYDVKNDAVFGANQPTIGNTISVVGPRNTVETLTVDGCDFRGGTSSSWVASSQTRNCLVKDCTFTGYMADHGVYCSMNVETYQVADCSLRDVSKASGVFKVRTSEHLRLYSISNVKAHNLNSYLAMLSLLGTPDAEVLLNNITVTKDGGNPSVFYGFCFNDETKALAWKGYNVRQITVRNCNFGYGYEGNSIIYSGAGSRVCAHEICYDHVTARESNFGGGVADKITVSNSRFDDCCGDKGIYLSACELAVQNSTFCNNSRSNCLFLINYGQQKMHSLSLRDVEIDANTTDLFNVVSGDGVSVNLVNCNVVRSQTNMVKAAKGIKVNLKNN